MVFSQKLVNHYKQLKEKAPDCLLLMQVGVFMQVMDEDARAVSKVTGLKLQMAGDVDAPVVLGGFPQSGVDAFNLPRPALRIAQQRTQLCSRLSGHVLVVQMGRWWELWVGRPEGLLPQERRRFPQSRLPTVRNILWESGLPVAWIRETGRRVTNINERVLTCRWPGVPDPRPLSSAQQESFAKVVN